MRRKVLLVITQQIFYRQLYTECIVEKRFCDADIYRCDGVIERNIFGISFALIVNTGFGGECVVEGKNIS